MDIKAKAEEIIAKIQKDPAVLANFKKDPIKTVEKLLGVDLPDEQLKKLVELVKAKVNLDTAGAVLSGLAGMLGKK